MSKRRGPKSIRVPAVMCARDGCTEQENSIVHNQAFQGYYDHPFVPSRVVRPFRKQPKSAASGAGRKP